MQKPIVRYSQLTSCKVGAGAIVLATNHPKTANARPVMTSEVVSYDPKTGKFETKNTSYIPAPFADWPDGQDCPVPNR